MYASEPPELLSVGFYFLSTNVCKKFFLILDSNYRNAQVEKTRQASLRLSSGQGICRRNYRGEPDRLPQDGELIWPAWGVIYFSHHGRCRVF